MTQVKIDIEIKNINKLKDAFKRAPEIVAPFLRTASLKSAFQVEGKAKVLTPVDTGRLRASIATSLGVANMGVSSIVSTDVKYAVFVHDGTRKMAGRPFMLQGVEQSVKDIENYYKDAQEQAMQKLADMAS